MNKILSKDEINLFKEQGAVFLKNKFDISWIEKLKKGIEIHAFAFPTIELGFKYS